MNPFPALWRNSGPDDYNNYRGPILWTAFSENDSNPVSDVLCDMQSFDAKRTKMVPYE